MQVLHCKMKYRLKTTFRPTSVIFMICSSAKLDCIIVLHIVQTDYDSNSGVLKCNIYICGCIGIL